MMTSSTATRRLAVLVLTLVLLAVTVLPVAAVSYPRAIDYVADDADVLTDETAAGIKKINKSLNNDTGCRVSVCTVRTTGAIDVAEYAKGVFTNWKLGEGVLLLLSTDDKSYYLLPSTGVESVLTTETLTEIRDTVLEPDFAAGDFDHAAAACVNKLAATMTASNLQKNAAQTTDTAPAEAKSTTAGSVIVTILKVILWLVIITVVAFVVLFIAALFNDTAAEILANTVFRKNHQQQSFHMAESDYDERLYGRPQQANGQRTASGNRPYPTNGQRSVDGQRSYPANGQRPNSASGNRSYPANGQPNRNANNPYRPQNGSYDYTGRRTR